MHAGMQRRAYTSYDVYRDYNSDELLDGMYPGTIDGVYTPYPADGRLATPQNNTMTPLNCRVTSARSTSRVRTSGRPPSRVEVSVQTENRAKPVVSQSQINYAIPDQSIRPTSPVQRMLDRCNTQPNISLNGPAPGSQMDPFTRQYYHRMWSNQSPSEIHLNRYGRAGGVWRHVRACVANTGSQMAFIDGTVKEEDNVFFPPWQNRRGQSSHNRVPFTTYSSQSHKITARFAQPTERAQSSTYRNKFNRHAKDGFKYWYQEPKPIDSKRVELARRRIMMAQANKPLLNAK